MSKMVLDASAILAYLLDEAGAELVTAVLETGDGIISSVNYAEVVSKLTDYQMPLTAIQLALDSLDLAIIDFDLKQALVAGELRKTSKPFGLSLGDRACLALGQLLQLPVLTADRNWALVPGNWDVRVMRGAN